MTGLPRSAESVTSEPSVEGRVKSGATSPTAGTGELISSSAMRCLLLQNLAYRLRFGDPAQIIANAESSCLLSLAISRNLYQLDEGASDVFSGAASLCSSGVSAKRTSGSVTGLIQQRMVSTGEKWPRSFM